MASIRKKYYENVKNVRRPKQTSSNRNTNLFQRFPFRIIFT